MLSVLAKRRYRWTGAPDLADAQDAELQGEPRVANESPELLLADTDLYAYKVATDVIIVGTAHPPGTCRSFEVRVRVNDADKRVIVLGERRVLRDGTFTEPQFTLPTALSYADAFGGADQRHLVEVGHPLESFRRHLADRPDILAANPFAYPRNPCGKGFLMLDRRSTDRGEELLPLFEDPEDRLTPQRRVAGAAFDWPRQPLPAGLGWFGYMWFPRSAHFGLAPDGPCDAPLREASIGLVDAAALSSSRRLGTPDPRKASGASPGLSVPHLRGGETIALDNLSAKGPSLELRLPPPPKRMRIDGRKGKMLDVEPVLSTVLIEPDAEQVTLVWRGTGPAIRPYLDEELEKMPFEVTW